VYQVTRVIRITAFHSDVYKNEYMTISSTIRHRSSTDSEIMIDSFINAHPQGAITTMTKEGGLQSSVINVFETNDSQYTFMTKNNTRKYINIHQNPTISFLTYDPFSRTEAEIEGVAIEVTNQKEIDKILTKIRSDSILGRWHTSPFVNEFDDYVLFTIYPHKVQMTTYWEHDNSMDVFHEYVEFETKTMS
jgi:general stress protein 26